MRLKPYRRYHTFVEKQKALLIALVLVALLDFIVSAVSMNEISRETERQMQRLAALHTQQVYAECTRAAHDMQRLLMENQDLTAAAVNGSDRERIYARGRLIDKISYSFGSLPDYHLFFYFEKPGDLLACSWIDMQNAVEAGIIDTILERVRTDEELTVDLYRWDSFEYGGSCYLLRAYRYNGVWFICYVPAGRLTAPLEEAYEQENNQVLLLSGGGKVLAGQEKRKEWRISDEMLKEGGTFYRFPAGRLQIVKESAAWLDFSIALVMKGYGGFSKIIVIQAAVFFTVLLTLFAFFAMNVYTKRRIIAPVQKFVTELLDYQESGDRQDSLSVSDIHELEQINEQFRNFVHQIGALKISIYEEKLQRQKLETDNLKLQLKPHLFLNILNIVHRLLGMGKTEDAKKMCLAAIRYLRYLFSAGMDSVSVKDAIGHVNDYLEIMKLRYPGEVETDIYVEEEAGACLVPPLVLQTLVENSFKYGKQSGKPLEISVTVTMDTGQSGRYLCLNVSDNGKGFPAEYLALWEKGEELDQKDGRHIGIANIRARLAYAYEGRADARFYNSPLGGAAVEIRIPVVDGKEAEG